MIHTKKVIPTYIIKMPAIMLVVVAVEPRVIELTTTRITRIANMII
jgi:hypothetical protein